MEDKQGDLNQPTTASGVHAIPNTTQSNMESNVAASIISSSSEKDETLDTPPSVAKLEKSHTEDDTGRSLSLRPTISRNPSATEPPNFQLVQEIAFVTIVCMAQLLTQAGLAQAIAPLHVIGESFNTDNPGQLSWLPAAYSLTVGTFILPAGRWGDLYGHRRLFIAGYVFFAVWSLVSGFAVWSRSLIFFAFCRAMAGIGPAMLIPNALAILGRTYPPGRRKNMVFAIFGATAPSGFVLGAVFSGIFTQFVWWPWLYWVGGMVLFLCAALVFVAVPHMPVSGDRAKFAELDPVGTLLGVVGLILFNFAWNEGPAAGWDQVYVYVLLIVGCILLGFFLWYELEISEYPLLPRSAFNRDNNLVLGCIAAGWGSFGIWLYYLWQYFEVVKGNSILLSTAQASPVAIVGATAAVSTGYVLGLIGPGWVMLMAMFAFCTGNILLATTPAHQTYWAQIFVANLITPFGMDMSFPAGTIVLSNHMPPEHQGIAASILCVIQNYSISIGLGMGGTVETHVNGGSLLRGYRGAWYVAIGLDVLGIILATCLVISWRSGTNAKAHASKAAKSREA